MSFSCNLFYAPNQMIRGILFLSCFFIVRHAYLTYKTLSIDAKVNDLVAFNVFLMRKKAFSELFIADSIVFYKHILFGNKGKFLFSSLNCQCLSIVDQKQ